MVLVSNITEKLIDDNLLFREAVSMGITNNTAIAKLLKTDVERINRSEVKVSTIARAIDRYSDKIQKKQKQFEFNFFKGIKLDSNVVYIVVHKTSDTLDKIRRAYYEIDFDEGAIFNILEGNNEIAIITNKDYKDLLLNFLNDEKITHIINNHDVISLMYSKDYSFTPGLMYMIFRNIAWDNINVLTWLHTPTELNILVHENDATRCYDILHKMQKNQKDNDLDSSSIKEQIIP